MDSLYVDFLKLCIIILFIADDDTSLTPDLEPSLPSPHSAEHKPEPTGDGEPEPAATDDPSPVTATVLRIASEPEPVTSDQVWEPTTELAMGKSVMDSESAEGSSAPCTMAEVELNSEDNMGIYADMPPLLLPVSIGFIAGGSLVSASSL